MPQLQKLLTQLNETIGVDLPMILKAILILVVGWLVARIAAAVVKHGLSRTEVDNWIAGWIAPRGVDQAHPLSNG